MKKNTIRILLTAAVLSGALLGSGCAASAGATNASNTVESSAEAAVGEITDAESPADEDSALDTSELFTESDLTQTADLTGADVFTVEDDTDIRIGEEGVYVLTGSASNVTVYIEADDQAKVRLVLDNVSITNEDMPCIYVTSADKVFVTTTVSENSLVVSGAFSSDGETSPDGAIFSKDDLTLNGLGTLTVSSSENGVVSNDDLKVTGGSYVITAGDDAVHANDILAIADGSLALKSAEGLEATVIRIDGGEIDIEASDDGINASQKSTAYRPKIEINGGSIKIVMAQGDTDGIDSNGDIVVNGGVIDVSGMSGFDYDGTAEFNGGTIYVNGEEIDAIPNQMFGGPGSGPRFRRTP